MSTEPKPQEVGEINLPDFLGARVEIELKSKLADPLFGKVVAATEGGIILKYKASSKAGLIELEEIQSIKFDNELTPIKPIELRWPTTSQVRKHLAVHHGFLLSHVNKMSGVRAADEHRAIHAGESANDLGHVHRGQDLLKEEDR